MISHRARARESSAQVHGDSPEARRTLRAQVSVSVTGCDAASIRGMNTAPRRGDDKGIGVWTRYVQRGGEPFLARRSSSNTGQQRPFSLSSQFSHFCLSSLRHDLEKFVDPDATTANRYLISSRVKIRSPAREQEQKVRIIRYAQEQRFQ